MKWEDVTPDIQEALYDRDNGEGAFEECFIEAV